MRVLIFTFLATLAIFQGDCKSLNEALNQDQVIWFPKGDGSDELVKAILSPPGDNRNAKAGDIKDAHFWLHTKKNPNPQEIFATIDSINQAEFIPGAPLKILIHGFGSSYTDGFPKRLVDEYLAQEEEMNIISLDWEILSAAPDYFSAFANAQLVSEHTAKLLDFLVVENLITLGSTHLIGFSLGGQVVGQIGSRVSSPGQISRITALDPAMPLFDYTGDFNRTDPTDAIFVDVIHTAANGLLGWREPCGHVDWYPNGGSYQPGCGIDPTGSCAHGRAPGSFIESVSSTTAFIGRKCDSYEAFLDGECNSNDEAVMGQKTPITTRGVYYLKTDSKSPYALGPDGSIA